MPPLDSSLILPLVTCLSSFCLTGLALVACIVSLLLLFRFAGRSQRGYLLDTVSKRKLQEEAIRITEAEDRISIVEDELNDLDRQFEGTAQAREASERELQKKIDELEDIKTKQTNLQGEVNILEEELKKALVEEKEALEGKLQEKRNELEEIRTRRTNLQRRVDHLERESIDDTDTKVILEKIEQKRTELQSAINEAKRIREQVEQEAADFAKSVIPSNIEEYGSGFYIEFGTVIIIIFTVLSLAILNVIEGQESATILAAIAGYVLGKSSARSSSSSRDGK